VPFAGVFFPFFFLETEATLLALLPAGVLFTDFGVLAAAFFPEDPGLDLDLDLERFGPGEEARESGEESLEEGVELRSASWTYLGFWIVFFLEDREDSSSASTNLGGAFFFLVERVDMMMS